MKDITNLSAKDIKKVNELLDQKKYIAEIIQIMKLSPKQVGAIEMLRVKKQKAKNELLRKEKIKFKKSRDNKIVSLFKKGWLKKDISEKLSVDLTTIELKLNNLGLLKKRQEANKTSMLKRDAAIVKLFGVNSSKTDIARQLDVSIPIVNYALSDAGVNVITSRGSSKEIKARIKNIHRLYKKGMAKKKIAEELGCARSFVSHTLRGDTKFQDQKVALKQKRVNKIIELKTKQKSDNVIADKLSISLSTVQKYYKEYIELAKIA